MTGDDARLLEDTALRVLGDHLGEPDRRPADGELPEELWRAVAAAGLPLTLVAEAAGGLGIAAGEAWGVLAALGRYGAPAPIADSLLAARLIAEHGLPEPEGAPGGSLDVPLDGPPGGPLGLALPENSSLTAERADGGWLLSGALAVAGGRHVRAAVAPVSGHGVGHVALAPVADAAVLPASASAVGPDGVTRFSFDRRPLPVEAMAPTGDPDRLLREGAILRSVQMAGALARVLDLTAAYAQDRVQFGRPLARFQAIQQQVAELAAEAALATAAARRALDLLDRPEGAGALFEIAAAKSQCGEAATRAAAIAHQVHGAIGFTKEYELQQLTRRLWAWREEFGSEAWWQRRLGALVAGAGADALWPSLSAG